MNLIKTIICISVFCICGTLSAEQSEEFQQAFENYKSQYNFYAIKDTMYTIQSELNLPEGFSHVEPKDSSSYAYWISNLPIWHRYKAVGSWRGGKSFEYNEVSRVVHLPWSGPSFKDVAIPVRLIGEFCFQTDNRSAFRIMPKDGEAFTYKKWLQGKPVFTSRGEVSFKDDIQKEDTEDEFYRLIVFSMQYVSFESIAKSCDTVAIEKVQAGDMYIAYDNTGKKGKLYIILHLISNDSGDIMYLAANGCPEACDFHIPKVNEDRNSPWINFKQLKELTKDYTNQQFYRFKSSQHDNNEN